MRPLLALVRAFLFPTAIADSWAGYFLARAAGAASAGTFALGDVAALAAVAGASVLAYAFGMATNDLFDLRKDRSAAPSRPLPSGELSPRAAAAWSAGMAAAALGLAAAVSAFASALILLGTALAYNGGGKRVPILGNLLMGSCRSLNLLLGALAATGGDGSVASSFAVSSSAVVLGLYTAGVTAISVLEDARYDRRKLRLATAALLLAPAAQCAIGWREPGAWINSALLAGFLWRGWGLAAASPPPPALHPAEAMVRRGLGGLYLVDAGHLFAHGDPLAAIGVYALWLLGASLKRIPLFGAPPAPVAAPPT